MTERIGFKMRLKPGFEEEYRRRHDAIWPELEALIRKNGVSDYSIFLDPETLTLFGVQKKGPGSLPGALADEPVMRRWWTFMKDIMEANPDDSPVVKPLVEVFHMD